MTADYHENAADTKKEICEENEDDEAALQQALLMSMQNGGCLQ